MLGQGVNVKVLAQSKLNSTTPALFLDYDGVLHPDFVTRTRKGYELQVPGHLMMHAGILAEIMQDFPDVSLHLSTTWVRFLGFRRACDALPQELRDRVLSATWQSRMRHQTLATYDIQSRFEQIQSAATRLGMGQWLAIDADPLHSWPFADDRLIRCHPTLGLGEVRTQMALWDKLDSMVPAQG